MGLYADLKWALKRLASLPVASTNCCFEGYTLWCLNYITYDLRPTNSGLQTETEWCSGSEFGFRVPGLGFGDLGFWKVPGLRVFGAWMDWCSSSL